MIIDDLLKIEGIERIYFGSNLAIHGFYTSELFGNALSKLKNSFCLITALQSLNALEVCRIAKCSVVIFCETTSIKQEIKKAAKMYDISLFTYKETTANLLFEIERLRSSCE